MHSKKRGTTRIAADSLDQKGIRRQVELNLGKLKSGSVRSPVDEAFMLAWYAQKVEG